MTLNRTTYGDADLENERKLIDWIQSLKELCLLSIVCLVVYAAKHGLVGLVSANSFASLEIVGGALLALVALYFITRNGGHLFWLAFDTLDTTEWLSTWKLFGLFILANAVPIIGEIFTSKEIVLGLIAFAIIISSLYQIHFTEEDEPDESDYHR